MAKSKLAKKTVEQRNGCDIDEVREDVELAGRGNKTAKVSSYMVLTTKKPRRIIKSRVDTIEAAREIADAQKPE